MQLNRAARELQAHMQKNGHHLSADKTNHLICMHGSGPFESSRGLVRQSRVLGAVCREARVPGPILSFDGVLRAELRNRIKGA
eukprot:217618-Pyramimonas_sp.AAC.1